MIPRTMKPGAALGACCTLLPVSQPQNQRGSNCAGGTRQRGLGPSRAPRGESRRAAGRTRAFQSPASQKGSPAQREDKGGGEETEKIMSGRLPQLVLALAMRNSALFSTLDWRADHSRPTNAVGTYAQTRAKTGARYIKDKGSRRNLLLAPRQGALVLAVSHRCYTCSAAPPHAALEALIARYFACISRQGPVYNSILGGTFDQRDWSNVKIRVN